MAFKTNMVPEKIISDGAVRRQDGLRIILVIVKQAGCKFCLVFGHELFHDVHEVVMWSVPFGGSPPMERVRGRITL